MLHGVESDDELQNTPQYLPSAGIGVERLHTFSCISCNDYRKMSGIGPATVIDFAVAGHRRPDNDDTNGLDARRAYLVIKVVARFPASRSVQDMREDISIASDMFHHQVVWVPTTGKHTHLSGTATSEVLQAATYARLVSVSWTTRATATCTATSTALALQ